MTSNCDWQPNDNELFPENFPDVGGMSFKWVKNNKKEFCEFVVVDMKKCTGFFLAFQLYLLKSN
jgi:hypothetical protein